MERVKIKGLDNFLSNLERIEKEMPRENKKLMNTIGEVVKGDINLVTPVDTGELRSKNNFKITGVREVTVYNSTKYAAHVEYGHRKKNGGYVQGQYFMKRGINNAAPKIPLIVSKFLKVVLKNDNK